MHLTLLLAAIATALAPTPDPRDPYHGRSGRGHVAVPLLDAKIVIDGRLDEPVWEKAALLTGFSQFSPHDGLRAADSTEVLVWYSATAIHFGIRAFEQHGAVHATHADRDKIFADDNVQLFIGTFHDHRQAFVFGVNPFGVQMDGAIVERGQSLSNGWNGALSARVSPDLNQDFVFSYQPVPGTVLFLGYGSSADAPPDAAHRFTYRPLTRDQDHFFLKLRYLFRS